MKAEPVQVLTGTVEPAQPVACLLSGAYDDCVKQRTATKRASDYHHGDLRKALLDLALAQIDQAGTNVVSLAALARELGVSQSAPYRHFGDKDQLLAAVASESFRIFIDALRKSTRGVTGKAATLAIAKAYIQFSTTRPGLYDLMFASGLVGAAAEDDTVKIAARESFGVLADALTLGPNRELRALRIWIGLHGTVMLNREGLLKPDYFKVSIDELVESILA
ncbi:AcrR family transcriptional regulator [Variibacter gotjawalensis]|uniref:TetR/AcrR family transcriptional regulator n=1 Tax=Variibacter gotjawalensis TaxID=1333996 RepID=UPI0018D52719|nr:TetR/AcrR family transcriptional regulator [Variibacter gotjawalensis]NIK48855.1 AcrR family transcriptional regulator [Variibacter gotjawalensis]